MMSDTIETFKTKLQQNGMDYRLLSDPQGQEIHIQFIGLWKQEEVLWHAQLFTIAEYNKQNHDSLKQQKMTIRQAEKQQYHIQIVLKLNILNKASILMAIKMIRQYKGLHLGSHYWN